ncbi:hypothetical protein C8R47DRAFT_1083094 [Mycena vitilis]|nr:hypothetical protein C8R47DRAFT_1083094 [Mycena vitilis]
MSSQECQLSALKDYESQASKERETMRLLMLPARGHPASTPLQPAQLPSTVLPTDPLVLEYPNKTLISVQATGAWGGLATEVRQKQREENARYCAKHFAGHVVLSPLDVVLARLSPALVDKLAALEQTARSGLDLTLEKAVLDNLRKESIPSSNPGDRTIQDRYWLSRLADAAREPGADNSKLVADYFPTPAEALPEQADHGYKKIRKYDAALRPLVAEKSTKLNIFLNVEYTRTYPPNLACNPLIGPSDRVGKYQQAITNADDLLTFQPTRRFVPTLSFHGKDEATSLFVSVLNQERLEFAVLENCFHTTTFPTVSALLHLFRVVSLYELGYNPLFVYTLSSPPADFSVGDVAPTSVVLPGAPALEVHLTGKRLSPLRTTPFERSTVVLQGVIERTSDNEEPIPVVVKLSSIDEARLWREKIIVEALYAGTEPGPAYAPELLAAFAGHGLPPLNEEDQDKPSGILPTGLKRRASALEELPPMVPRHLELMIFRSPPGARVLKSVTSTADLLSIAKQLFAAILDAFRRRVLHRDISVTNVLSANNQLLIVDWELGRRLDDPLRASGNGTVTGTLDTMSVASLENQDPLPHDDVESAVYVLLKVLTQNFVPPSHLQREWKQILEGFFWDDPSVAPSNLASIRATFWSQVKIKGTTIRKTVDLLQTTGHETLAQIVVALLSLPLPDQRDGPLDYDAVLSSLEDLVGKAIAAASSVDASSLDRSVPEGLRKEG